MADEHDYNSWPLSVSDVQFSSTGFVGLRWWQFVRRFHEWQMRRKWRAAGTSESAGRFSFVRSLTGQATCNQPCGANAIECADNGCVLLRGSCD